jgi:uncharacterized phage-like protein YoqJ
MDTGLILAGTGHRPHNLGGYNEGTYKKLGTLASLVIVQLEPVYTYCGGALGWDMYWGHALLSIGVPYTLALPFPDMGSKWNPKDRHNLEVLKEGADRVHYASDKYSKGAYILRDRYMVDNSQGLVSLLKPGLEDSGTYTTTQYAIDHNKPVLQLWELFTRL